MPGKTRRRRLPMLMVAVVVVVVGGSAGAGAATGARASSRQLATFTVHGSYAWTVPAGVTKVTFDVFGASGGSTTDAGGHVLISSGGAGGEARAQFTVKPGETFEIVVGGRGADGNSTYVIYSGGFNGGGASQYSGSGGGGSDVRLGGHGNGCASTRTCGYTDRVIVGGGGGGGGGGCGLVDRRPSRRCRRGSVRDGCSRRCPLRHAGGRRSRVRPGRIRVRGGADAGRRPRLRRRRRGRLVGGACCRVEGGDGSGGGGGSGFISPFRPPRPPSPAAPVPATGGSP